ncbi:hypothetical protein EVAR_4218_1 [Eumeta japonica]|uniref:Uncharacterized protein n=1 Tax=Eumeta variegata TaxID=151549 RepID=A0A4C1TGY5_EUMVA|nr:hypothetical protein EVAR_4218_1 [Eumeta japonica]
MPPSAADPGHPREQPMHPQNGGHVAFNTSTSIKPMNNALNIKIWSVNVRWHETCISIFELLILLRIDLLAYLQERQLIDNRQYGFRSGSSASDLIICLPTVESDGRLWLLQQGPHISMLAERLGSAAYAVKKDKEII